MEMLQAKQEQEKKRLREQMEAEAAVQRQQMENMVKAKMMEVKKNTDEISCKKTRYSANNLHKCKNQMKAWSRKCRT